MPTVPVSSLPQFLAVNLLRDPGYDPANRTIPNCCEVRLNWTLQDGKVAHNILHASYSGTPPLSSALAQTIFAAITGGATWTALQVRLNVNTLLTGVTLTDIRSLSGLAVNSTGAGVPGTSASPALPDEVALVVRLQTNNRGRSGRGRAYQPGFAADSMAPGNTVLAATVTALQAWYANNVAIAIANNLGVVVLGLHSRVAYQSPSNGATIPARPATTVPVTSYVVDNHWDTQRRRGLR